MALNSAKGLGCAALAIGNLIGVIALSVLVFVPFLPGDCAPDVDCRAAHAVHIVPVWIVLGLLAVLNMGLIGWLLSSERED